MLLRPKFNPPTISSTLLHPALIPHMLQVKFFLVFTILPATQPLIVSIRITKRIYRVLTWPLDLQLSISLVGSNSTTAMVMSADISQGFSFQKQVGGGIVFEHQLNVKYKYNGCVCLYLLIICVFLVQPSNKYNSRCLSSCLF